MRCVPLFLIASVLMTSACSKSQKPDEDKDPEKKKFVPMTFSVTPAFYGYYLPGQWTSLTVRMDGGSEERKGRIRVECSTPGGSIKEYSREVTVPPTSKQVYRFEVRPESDKVSVSFIKADNGQSLAPEDVTLREIRLYDYSEKERRSGVVLLSSDMAGVKRGFPSEWRMLSLVMSPFDLPEKWCAYEFASTMVVSPSAFRPLNELQVRAIRDWVQAGGRLVVDTSLNDLNILPKDIRDLLPAKVKGMEEMDRSLIMDGGTGKVEVARMSLAEGAGLGMNRQWPVAVEGATGMGSVVMTCVPLTDAVFDCSPDAMAYKARILSMRIHGIALPSLSQPANQVYSETGRARKLPVAVVLTLAIAFILLVGPVDYFVLKRLGHLEWTWLTFSASSLIFTGVLLTWVYRAKTGVLGTVTMAMIACGAGGAARTVSVTDVYSQKNDYYSFSADAGCILRVIPGGAGNGDFIGSLVERKNYKVKTSPEFTIDSYHMPIWTHLHIREDHVGTAPIRIVSREKDSIADVDSGEYAVDLHKVIQDVPDMVEAYDQWREDILQSWHSENMRVAQLELFPERERRFLIAALSEYYKLMNCDARGISRISVRRSWAKHSAVSIQGRKPTSGQVAYIFSLLEDTPQAVKGGT